MNQYTKLHHLHDTIYGSIGLYQKHKSTERVIIKTISKQAAALQHHITNGVPVAEDAFFKKCDY